ncbi:MAG: hypothetical protein ACLFR1_14685 [Spirochaetia bacterium]
MTNKKIQFLSFFAAATMILLLLGCGAGTYSSENLSFSIPAGWEVNATPEAQDMENIFGLTGWEGVMLTKGAVEGEDINTNIQSITSNNEPDFQFLIVGKVPNNIPELPENYVDAMVENLATMPLSNQMDLEAENREFTFIEGAFNQARNTYMRVAIGELNENYIMLIGFTPQEENEDPIINSMRTIVETMETTAPGDAAPSEEQEPQEGSE